MHGELVFSSPAAIANVPRPFGRPEPQATPQRLKTAGRSDKFDPETSRLQWPATFVTSPIGEQLELSEDGLTATRQNGVGRGICFVGPLQVENGTTYFEVEVLEMEANRTQTMAIGICTSLPAAKPLLAERAANLGQGSYLMGYDLPKLFVHGQDVGKIPVKEWRPLKELAAGDRVGLLVERASMELTVFINGKRKASMTCPPGSAGEGPNRWSGEVFGVVDVYGTVKSVRVHPCLDKRRGAGAASTPSRMPAPLIGASPCQTPVAGVGMPPPPQAVAAQLAQEKNSRVRKMADLGDAPQRAKRPRLAAHPCGCTVHLMRHTGCVVHVPNLDFIIGRNPKSCNLTLDSTIVPNMASRKHARVLSTDDGVEVVDCESLNGTWVNDAQVNRHQLRQGDVLVIGKPAQGPADFRFTVSLPQ